MYWNRCLWKDTTSKGNAMKTGYLIAGALVLLLLISQRSTIMQVILPWKHVKNAEKYLPLLRATEIKYGIPEDLLARMAYQESHFLDDVVSGKRASSAGALGIMQLVPKWHPNVDPLNVPAAIDYAGKFVRDLYSRLGSWHLAVAAYNAGEGNVRKYNGVPPFKETENYVDDIFTDLFTAIPADYQRMYA